MCVCVCVCVCEYVCEGEGGRKGVCVVSLDLDEATIVSPPSVVSELVLSPHLRSGDKTH